MEFKKITDETYDCRNPLDLLPNSVREMIEFEIRDIIDFSMQSLVDCESPIEQMMSLALNGLLNYDHLNIVEIRKQEVIECGNKKYRVDFEIPTFNDITKQGKMFVIECDGHDFHQKTKEQVRKDNQRTRDLVSNGYIVCRFSGSEIFESPYKCVCEVKKLIESTNSKEGE